MNEDQLTSNPAGQELRSTDRPMYGAAAANVNDTIYIYGGFYGVSPWNMEAMWTLPAYIDPKELTQVKTDAAASPVLIYSQLVYPMGQYLYAFGGHHPTFPKTSNSSSMNATEPLRYYRFDLKYKKWTPLYADQLAPAPLERYWHTATLNADHTSVYVFGGMNMTGATNDFWQYDMQSNAWQSLTLPTIWWKSRCGHTASMLSSGVLLILGGYDCIGNYTSNAIMSKILAPMDSAVVFNTITQSWANQTLAGDIIPVPRAYHSAVITKGDKVVICGGQDGAAQPFQTYISAGGDTAAMTAVLDTNSWQWMIPDPSPYQPFPRSFAAASVVNDTKMIIGFGINYHTIYDGIYIFDVQQGTWMPASDAIREPGNSLVFLCGIAAIASFLCAAVLTGCYFALKKLKVSIYQCTKSMRNDVWNPRPGEPAWAEISRLIFRVTFLTMFLTIIVVLILQVRNSPIIDQKYYVHNDHYTVDVPDIRFCFDGWTSENSVVWPYIQCATDFGDSCSEYLIDISKNVETGLNYYGTALRCYLFRAPPTFRLGRTNDRIVSNGSYLKFYYYGDRLPSNISHLHLVFYNKYHNPNLPVYHINDPYTLPFSWYSESEDAQFQSAEEENLRTENSFDLNPNVGSTSSFAIIEREEIKSTYFWNYIGIASVHKRAFEIESKAVSETVTTVYATEPQPLGSLHVFPASYEVTVLREQRAFTLVNAMGIIGGIFGLILGLQTCLFGYRPRSPWGVIHRWSMGQMRRSLLFNLKSRFPENINVPIIHPLHRRQTFIPIENKHSGQLEAREPVLESVQERMDHLEERLHVFELLFQAYYINDEVFRSLDHALQLEGVAATDHSGWREFLISRGGRLRHVNR